VSSWIARQLNSLAKFTGAGLVGDMLFPQWKSSPRLGADGVLKAYTTMPWLRTFSQKISHDFATLTWQVMVPTTGKGRSRRPIRDVRIQRSRRYTDRSALLARYAKAGDLAEIPGHPLLDLLTKGNEFFSGLVALQLSQQYLDLVGELPWILALNQYGMPVDAVPIPPTWVTELPASNRNAVDGEGYYIIAGPGGQYQVPSKNMWWSYHPTPANPFTRGTGLAQVLGDELETDEAAAKHTKDWFINRAIPPVLISGLGMGVPELQRLEQKWLSKFLRVGTGWLPHFMNAEVKVHQLSQTFADQQLGDLRNRERDMIRMTFGIPPEVIGDVSNSNRSTIEASDFIYQSRVIVPRAEFFRAAMQERLAPLFDERIIVDYINPVAEDREFMLKVRSAQPHAWELDEWREFGGSEALPANRGKIHLMPFNLAPVRLSAGELPPDPALLPAPGADEEPVDGDEGEEAEDVIDAEVVEEAARRRTFAPTTKGLTAAEIRQIANAAKAATLTRRGERTLRAVIQEFGDQTISDAGLAVTFNMNTNPVAAHIRQFGAERVVGINDTTRKLLREALADGVDKGESAAKLRKRIIGVFDDASKSRANNIARTEVTRASNFGAMEGLRQAGAEEKEWLATQDGHVRDTHAAMDHQVRKIDELFEARGKRAMYPGDFGLAEEDCNCRCAVITPLAVRSGTRIGLWKSMESNRAPFYRSMRRDFRQGFTVQQKAVLAALTAATKGGESCRRTA
jgi:SPP1 gp7 family putative phage head morphogenesis protein